jgi:hypothetical protein
MLLALPGLWVALNLVTNQVREGGWIALALASAVWVPLAVRVLAMCVTLTADTLVIRNVFSTEKLPLADLIEVGFRRGQLTVTRAYGEVGSDRFAVSAASLGSSRWSGLQCTADEVAAAITDAAGLPPLPKRREVISRNRARLMFLAGGLCLAFGVSCGPMQTGNRNFPFVAHVAGAILYTAGVSMFGLAFRVDRDHRRKRTQHVAADE